VLDGLHSLASRVVMGAFPGPTLPSWMTERLDAGLGSVCLFGSNIASAEQLASLTAQIHAVGPDVLITTDEEGGDVTRLHGRDGSPHPGNAALGAVDDPTLTEAVARSIGVELFAAGIDLNAAPVVDVNSNPANPVIGVRSFGADPSLVARHARAYIAGLQSAGVGACVKHFPGHGDTGLDSHLDLPTVDAPLDVLRRRELAPFAAAVAAGTLAVMTSHVLLPAIDPLLPATLSPAVIALLRDDLGFDGLLVSDALDMKGASAGRGEPAAAVLALAAGCDLLCLGAEKDAELHDAIVVAVVAAVRAGELAESRLVEAAQRVLRASRQVQEWRANVSAETLLGGERPASPAVPGSAAALVARRALRLTGALPELRGAVVLRFQTSTNVAVGPMPWGLPADGQVLSGGRQVDVLPTSRIGDLLALAPAAPLVALVREPHRHGWVPALLAALADARPDLVVVEMGWPGDALPPGVTTVLTYGASRASAAALDELLAGGSAAAVDGTRSGIRL
jgi:beta-N-acetylhexosaminidase